MTKQLLMIHCSIIFSVEKPLEKDPAALLSILTFEARAQIKQSISRTSKESLKVKLTKSSEGN